MNNIDVELVAEHALDMASAWRKIIFDDFWGKQYQSPVASKHTTMPWRAHIDLYDNCPKETDQHKMSFEIEWERRLQHMWVEEVAGCVAQYFLADRPQSFKARQLALEEARDILSRHDGLAHFLIGHPIFQQKHLQRIDHRDVLKQAVLGDYTVEEYQELMLEYSTLTKAGAKALLRSELKKKGHEFMDFMPKVVLDVSDFRVVFADFCQACVAQADVFLARAHEQNVVLGNTAESETVWAADAASTGRKLKR